jgi:hypothetical protein
MTKFWMVWREHGGGPTMPHTCRKDAEREAERLARKNPGENFIVLEAVAACSKNDIIWDTAFVDGMPF